MAQCPIIESSWKEWLSTLRSCLQRRPKLHPPRGWGSVESFRCGERESGEQRPITPDKQEESKKEMRQQNLRH